MGPIIATVTNVQQSKPQWESTRAIPFSLCAPHCEMCTLSIFVSCLCWGWVRNIGKALWKIVKQCSQACCSFWNTNLYGFSPQSSIQSSLHPAREKKPGLLDIFMFHCIMLLSEREHQDSDCPCFVALRFRQESLWLSPSDPAQDEQSLPDLVVIVPPH